jgi:serine/threonine-protein phosphatase 2A regulatory subunit B''
LDKFAKTDAEAMAKLVKSKALEKQAPVSAPIKVSTHPIAEAPQAKQPDIPRFYFPEGKPGEKDHLKTAEETIDKLFSDKVEMKKEDFEAITTEVCGLPKFLKGMLFDRIDTGKSGKITKPAFQLFWRREF